MTDQERWNANESLLQSYRSIFISSVSFLLAVGAIVAEKSIAVLMAVAVVSVLMIWAIWFRVVRARHLIVDYYMYRSLNGVPKRTMWGKMIMFTRGISGTPRTSC